jgi:arylsulfatase A-like enzyme
MSTAGLRAPLVAIALICCAGCSGEMAEGTPRPDVVLVTLDTTRADHLGCYGYSRNVTPELDRFALEAVLYRAAWSTASWTLPAHASILTGKHPSSHGAHVNSASGDLSLANAVPDQRFADLKVNRLGEQAVTLAELLDAAGYETAAIVGGPWLAPVFGLLQGYALADAEVSTLAGRAADQLTDRAIAWIRGVPRERPLHLLLNYFEPHWPYEPPPGYDDLPGAQSPIEVSAAEVNDGATLDEAQRRAYLARYDGEIRFMDHHFGRLVDALREAGRFDGALIVVTADHGESFGEHGLMSHGPWLYEEILRVPLLIHFPGGRGAGTAVDAPVSLVDLLPLIAEAIGVPVPPGVEGVPPGRRELVLAESSRDAHWVRAHGARFDQELAAGIRWPWKLIVSDRGAQELFRLDEDPGELLDRAGEAAAADLRSAIDAARARLVPPPPTSPTGVDPQTLDLLRDLGYAE